MKTFFGGHPKKGLHDRWGKKLAGKVTQNFSGKFGKIWAKILRTPKNVLAPTLMVLIMQLPQHATCESKYHFPTQLCRTYVNENSSTKVNTIHMKAK